MRPASDLSADGDVKRLFNYINDLTALRKCTVILGKYDHRLF